MNKNELWKKVFDTLLSKGDVYEYDYDAVIKELEANGFLISLENEESIFCDMCVSNNLCIEKGFCIRLNPGNIK